MVFFHSKSPSCSFAINASYIHCMVSIQTTASLLISVVGPLRGFLFSYWYLLSSFQKHLSLRGLQNCNTQIGFQSQHIIKENCMEIDGKLSANIRKYEKSMLFWFSVQTQCTLGTWCLYHPSLWFSLIQFPLQGVVWHSLSLCSRRSSQTWYSRSYNNNLSFWVGRAQFLVNKFLPWDLVITIFDKGAYLKFKSIPHKALNLF